MKFKNMKDIKLIAIDLDDTLLGSDGQISERNILALKKASEKGLTIILATGRMTSCTEPFVDTIGIDCPVVVYNGAMVRDKRTLGRKILFHLPLEIEYSDTVIDYCFRNGFCLNLYVDEILYSQDNPDTERFRNLYSGRTNAQYNLVDDLRIFRGKRSTKLILITDHKSEDVARTRDYQFEYFTRLFNGKVNLFRTDPEYLEIQNKNTDKGIGLGVYATKYKISRDQILAFGNGENDIAMLKYAGTGVAVRNASDTVKKHADFVAEWSNGEDCVARWIEEYILTDPR